MEEEQSPAEETSLAAEEEQALQEEEESLWEEAGAEAVSVESEDPEYSEAEETFDTEVTIAEDGVYTSKEDVSLYIHIYERLPDNFMTKKEAQALGWEGGSLEPYAPGMCIGGNRFGNYEGLLPEEDGRTYTECDIDTLGASSRGAKRIVFSNDGLIYYTEDHYETFELLYGEE
ncbi:MAG: ribonuclease [Ruminococcus sp.]|nr:ribonuclease [Ruminococcus sp.]